MVVGLASPDYVSERITVSASSEHRYGYEFKPDQIYFFSPVKSMVNGVDIYLEGAKGGGRVPILAQGPVVLPGISENQRVRLVNNEIYDVELLIIAQRGYPPVSVAAPTTLIRPDSVAIQSQLAFEASDPGTSYQIANYSAVGRYHLVGVAIADINSGSGVDLTGVQVGGTSGSELAQVSFANGNYRSLAGWWWVDNEINAVTNIVLSLSASNASVRVYGQVMSFLDGLKSGNAGTAGAGTIDAFADDIDVEAQEDESVVWCICSAVAAGAIPTWNGMTMDAGPTIWLPSYTFPAGASKWNNTIWGQRTGAGTMNFAFDQYYYGRGMSIAAVEVTVT